MKETIKANRLDNNKEIKGYLIRLDGRPFIFESLKDGLATKFINAPKINHAQVFGDRLIEVKNETICYGNNNT